MSKLFQWIPTGHEWFVTFKLSNPHRKKHLVKAYSKWQGLKFLEV